MAIRVFHADDHQTFRDGMRLILEREPDIEVVGSAGDTGEAVRIDCVHADGDAGKAGILVTDIDMNLGNVAGQLGVHGRFFKRFHITGPGKGVTEQSA